MAKNPGKTRCNYTLSGDVVAKLKIMNQNLPCNPKYSQIVEEAINERFEFYAKDFVGLKNAWNDYEKRKNNKIIGIKN